MGRIDKFCPMCGATPGNACTVISGTGEPGDQPGDTRSEPHFYRHNDAPIRVLIPDEPDWPRP